MARYDAKSVDPHHQRKQTAMEKPVRQEEPDNLQDLFKVRRFLISGSIPSRVTFVRGVETDNEKIRNSSA